jgi:threonine dehydratase
MVTPQIESHELAHELGVPKLYFKREDLHPLGSHKGRSIPVMIDAKYKEGARSFAISSSGNAALAAIRHVQTRNLNGDKVTLKVLIGENINPKKKQMLLDEIKDPHVTIEESSRPLQALFNLIKGEKVVSLRQSNDPMALEGYTELARELAQTPDLDAVFIATSSGTAAQAIGEYFVKENKHAEIHIVQTSSTAPFAKTWNEDEENNIPSLADAIVDKIAHRKDPLLKVVSATRGKGWIASNEFIERAMSLLSKAGIEATPNGALGLAGLMKALSKGKIFRGAIVCVITGK